MVAIQCYLLITVVLYVFGPWKWQDPNMLATVVLLLLIQVVLWIGFGTGRISVEREDPQALRFGAKALDVIVVLGLVVTLLQCLRTLGTIDFLSIRQLVSQGLTDAATQYSASKAGTGQFGGPVLTYAIVLTAPLAWMAIPLSLYHFRELSFPIKIAAVANIVFEVSRWLAIGTNKGVFDVFFVCVAVMALRVLRGWKGLRGRGGAYRKRVVAAVVVIGVLAVAALWVFSNNVGSRVNGHWDYYQITNGNTPIDADAPLMAICPETLKPTLILATSYLTQGYYAFALARLVDWVPLFGAGNSMFLLENIQEATGADLFQLTYQARLEQFDWDPLVNWHSFYVWIANDVGIVGIFAVLFLMGFFFYQVAWDAIELESDIAIVLFCLFAIMFFYLPANNQILSYPTTFMAFWVLFIAWRLTRRRGAMWKGRAK